MFKPTIVLLLLASQLIFSQKKSATTYQYGYNGMELIVQSKKETIIVSTFHSKLAIKDDIAIKVYEMYATNSFIDGDSISIKGNQAEVSGKIKIRKKGNLILVDFYYDEIQWKTGLVEAFDD